MQVVTRCPLRATSFVWRPSPEAWTLTIVVKSTFWLVPGLTALADHQLDPLEVDALWEPSSPSIRAPSDLVPFKAGVDVLVVGSAHAPEGRPARALRVALSVGSIDKALEAWCDRVVTADGRVLEGHPFIRMPLRYERAAGGAGTANPVGMRFDSGDAVRIPNLQPAGVRVARPGDRFEPIGFGPVPSAWATMRRGQRDSPWREPLPEDLDPAVFNTAPIDQRLDVLRADEAIVLENLHPRQARFMAQLPGLQPYATLAGSDGSGADIPLVADTLWLDTDAQIATVTYRGSVALSHPGESGTIEVTLERADAHDRLDDDDEEGSTLRMAAGERATMLGARVGENTLPFVAAGSPWAGFKRPEPPRARREETGTLHGGVGAARDVLPFVWNALRVDAPPPSPFSHAEAPEAPAQSPESTTPADPIDDDPSTEPDASVPAPAPLPSPAPAPTPAVEEKPEVENAELPLDRFPLERCAAIAASIARAPAESAAILKTNELDAPTWAALEQHHDAALAEEATRSKVKLLQSYNQAFVARLEEERGPIGVDDYARVVVATERGSAAAVLEELGLPAKAMMRIERVWLRKIVSDPKLGKGVSKALKAAREA